MNLKHENKNFEFSAMFESSSEESLLSLDNTDLLLVNDKKRSKSVEFIRLEPILNRTDIKKKSKSFDFIKIPFSSEIKYDNYLEIPKIGERKLSRSFNSVDSFKELIKNEEKYAKSRCRKRDYEMFPVSKSPQISDVIKLLDYKISPLSPNNHIKNFGSYDDFFIDYE